MKKNEKQTDKSRRQFLRGTLAGSTGAALAVTAPGITAATAVDETSETDKSKKGYRLSQHIVDYYKTAAS